ncbi:MAG: bifunctional phosphopantothenoylcysteine decarboxylase/phosphopantothenate--cysteine ligase CoaBC [ANME-2 cluster archaeon]|nr:bifunctional phosphopantothenoylcysteine decarboxylase/phosphopantothenate--cysteine ligase CoaBC [ANME-2 cluster archaeon]MBC2699941.1 bifunctional phosphopantothenoylcysteine decarboxylase/phosphopantothenate--cysteine ligase CoaBC [ANME-2 cluster archaeon]MBC2707054.1 bifunctional phosphopantothenoylcysteine decarboxylase/phosphopantothenate--cysteine ligase CoaBC [ANME-2 cluster archaeon]MBC2746932.1 bifunctional phosphopantothenoylcysteine decarboxylase/phosphopantothenate--cysteine liga
MTMNEHPTLLLTGTLSATLKNRTIVLAVTGSIAAVRTIELARELVRHGATVRVVMSQAAQGIIHPDALHYATGHPVMTRITGAVEHVEYCGEEGTADLLLVAPCTANTISKMALGIDDTPPTTFATTAMGSGIPLLVVPAMHGSMYNHLAIRENIERLKSMGVLLQDPLIDEKTAKIAANEDIVLEVQRILGDGSLDGRKVLITGGGTIERIDAIRVLTNRSSGRTGVELAREAYRKGADVTLVHPGLQGLYGITEVEAVSAKDMTRSVLDEIKKGCDLFISSAAISDYTVEPVDHKIKSGQEALILTLRPAQKLTQKVRENYPELDIIGFKAEANVDKDGLIASAKELMAKYGLSIVVANDVGKGGMGTRDNTVYILDSPGGETGPVTGDKQVIAGAVLDRFIEVNG